MQESPVVYFVFTVVAEIAANEMLERYPHEAVRIPYGAIPASVRADSRRPVLFALSLPDNLAAEFCTRVRNLEN